MNDPFSICTYPIYPYLSLSVPICLYYVPISSTMSLSASTVSLYIPIYIYHVPICPCLSLLCIYMSLYVPIYRYLSCQITHPSISFLTCPRLFSLSLSIFLCNCPYLSIYFPVPISLCMSIPIPVSLYMSLSLSLYICPYKSLYLFLSLYLSVPASTHIPSVPLLIHICR